jgi:glutathione S-transferase
VTSEIEIVWFPGSCSRVTLIALEEIGAEYTSTVVSWGWGNDPDYLALNPKGKVPTLLIDDTSLTETPAILTHLAQRHPTAGLLPAGADMLTIDVLGTMSWFAAGVHPLAARLRFPMSVNDDPASFERTRRVAADGLHRCFEILEHRLSGRDWLYGDWSILDAYLQWLWFRAVGSGMDGTLFARCADHARSCEQRPSVRRALHREESEYAHLLASDTSLLKLPPHQVGCAPAVAHTMPAST